MQRGKQKGFTLVELIITVTVAIILLGVAVPNVMGTLRANRLSTTMNSIVQALQLARSQAIRSGGATVCASKDGLSCLGSADWTGGWIVLDRNGKVLRTFDAPAKSVSLQATFGGVEFANTGNITPIYGTVSSSTQGFGVWVHICEPGDPVDKPNRRLAAVLFSGKVFSNRYTCSGKML